MKPIVKTSVALIAGVAVSCFVCYMLFQEVFPVASLIGTLPGLLIMQQQKNKAA